MRSYYLKGCFSSPFSLTLLFSFKVSQMGTCSTFSSYKFFIYFTSFVAQSPELSPLFFLLSWISSPFLVCFFVSCFYFYIKYRFSSFPFLCFYQHVCPSHASAFTCMHTHIHRCVCACKPNRQRRVCKCVVALCWRELVTAQLSEGITRWPPVTPGTFVWVAAELKLSWLFLNAMI